MKYTKTVPYFKEGDTVKKRVEVGNTGKTKEEIKAEALSHQTREKGQQAMDKEAKLEAENRKKASVSSDNISKPKTDLSTKTIAKQPLAKTFGRSLTEIKRAPVKQSLDKLSFGEAFNRSHKEGLKVFEWRGEKYTTKTAEEEAALRSGDTAVTVTNVGDTNTEDKSSSVVNSNVGSGVLRSDQQQSETPTINYGFNSGMTTTPTPNNTQKTNVTNTTGSEVTKIRDTSPYSGPSIWADRDRIRNIPQNFRNSREATQQFFDGVNLMYEDFGKTTPGKIMNNPTQSQHLLGALPLILWGKIKKHTNPMFQQGGSVQQSTEGSQEELMLDFAVRYLVTIGVPEEDIMDPQGNLNPEHQQELEQVFNSQEIAWSDYAASPDEYMQQFIGNLQAQTQMARKGAKLKRLSQLRIYKK